MKTLYVYFLTYKHHHQFSSLLNCVLC